MIDFLLGCFIGAFCCWMVMDVQATQRRFNELTKKEK